MKPQDQQPANSAPLNAEKRKLKTAISDRKTQSRIASALIRAKNAHEDLANAYRDMGWFDDEKEAREKVAYYDKQLIDL